MKENFFKNQRYNSLLIPSLLLLFLIINFYQYNEKVANNQKSLFAWFFYNFHSTYTALYLFPILFTVMLLTKTNLTFKGFFLIRMGSRLSIFVADFKYLVKQVFVFWAYSFSIMLLIGISNLNINYIWDQQLIDFFNYQLSVSPNTFLSPVYQVLIGGLLMMLYTMLIGAVFTVVKILISKESLVFSITLIGEILQCTLYTTGINVPFSFLYPMNYYLLYPNREPSFNISGSMMTIKILYFIFLIAFTYSVVYFSYMKVSFGRSKNDKSN